MQLLLEVYRVKTVFGCRFSGSNLIKRRSEFVVVGMELMIVEENEEKEGTRRGERDDAARSESGARRKRRLTRKSAAAVGVGEIAMVAAAKGGVGVVGVSLLQGDEDSSLRNGACRKMNLENMRMWVLVKYYVKGPTLIEAQKSNTTHTPTLSST
ncbi:hypothetical protein Salat_1209100 [Sesamum alatum]|uniref:Uncharacterized protein n=1 Tax=Sesamum alatum TaxID=300844 RepID=A0AAE1YFT4_9LAMI|nr:hypothetical protein Salat_1209100 [Sesamum alatum]